MRAKLTALAFFALFATGASACDVYLGEMSPIGTQPILTFLPNGNFIVEDDSGTHEYARVRGSIGSVVYAGIPAKGDKIFEDDPGGVAIREYKGAYLVDMVVFEPTCKAEQSTDEYVACLVGKAVVALAKQEGPKDPKAAMGEVYQCRQPTTLDPDAEYDEMVESLVEEIAKLKGL